MTVIDSVQVILYFLILLLLVKPLGWYIAQVYQRKPCGLDYFIGSFEQLLYRLCSINCKQQMNWKRYLSSMLSFNFLGFLAVYFIQRMQFYLPFNPQNDLGVPPLQAFNTAASFITNTNWQSYSGEVTLSYCTQMLALTVQNFTSAATGLSVLMAFIRGLSQHEQGNLGNFWVDTLRGILYILLPLSFLVALFLISQGVIQNMQPNQKVTLIQPIHDETGQTISEQIIPMGPVASQIAIKQLGSNGGGFFNVNSAHPFENPTPLTNFVEMICIMLIPMALCYTFGILVQDKRQGWTIFIVMFFLLTVFSSLTIRAELQGNPNLTSLGVQQTPENNLSPGGNMEGKETRFGIVNSALWASVTTASSNGSVNSMLDSFTPLGGLMPLFMMCLGEVVFGGVGSGLYGMFMIVIMTVFIVGLMVGRTPEYLGKKIEPYDMKMATLAILIMPIMTLLCTAIASVTQAGTNALSNSGAHGLSQMLYAFTSMASNNGSAFLGLKANTPFYTLLGGLTMLITRYWIAIPTLAIAGSLAKKKKIPTSTGTLPTNTPLFIVLLISVTLLVGGLSFIPALALGPIAEQFILWEPYHGH